jgi:hypothetical protein
MLEFDKINKWHFNIKNKIFDKQFWRGRYNENKAIINDIIHLTLIYVNVFFLNLNS